jgi:hypothetical protein
LNLGVDRFAGRVRGSVLSAFAPRRRCMQNHLISGTRMGREPSAGEECCNNSTSSVLNIAEYIQKNVDCQQFNLSTDVRLVADIDSAGKRRRWVTWVEIGLNRA